MKIYISGPMTGVENYKQIFEEYEKKLTELGFTVFNPAWFDYKQGWDYDEILELDLAALQKCEAIFMLPGWEKSKGACIEYGYAMAKGLNIMHMSYLEEARKWEEMHAAGKSKAKFGEPCGDCADRNLPIKDAKCGQCCRVNMHASEDMYVMQACKNCKDGIKSLTDEPCVSCNRYSNWERKEE